MAGSSPINNDNNGYSAQVLKARQSVGKRSQNKTINEGHYHQTLSGTQPEGVLKTIDINHILDQQQRVDDTLRQYKSQSTSSKQSMGVVSGSQNS